MSNYLCSEYFQYRVAGANGVYYKSSDMAFGVKEVILFYTTSEAYLCVVITCKGKKTRMLYSFFNSLQTETSLVLEKCHCTKQNVLLKYMLIFHMTRNSQTSCQIS